MYLQNHFQKGIHHWIIIIITIILKLKCVCIYIYNYLYIYNYVIMYMYIYIYIPLKVIMIIIHFPLWKMVPFIRYTTIFKPQSPPTSFMEIKPSQGSISICLKISKGLGPLTIETETSKPPVSSNMASWKQWKIPMANRGFIWKSSNYMVMASWKIPNRGFNEKVIELNSGFPVAMVDYQRAIRFECFKMKKGQDSQPQRWMAMDSMDCSY